MENNENPNLEEIIEDIRANRRRLEDIPVDHLQMVLDHAMEEDHENMEQLELQLRVIRRLEMLDAEMLYFHDMRNQNQLNDEERQAFEDHFEEELREVDFMMHMFMEDLEAELAAWDEMDRENQEPPEEPEDDGDIPEEPN
ncbi:hypothetical protein GCK72_003469 [Caenorhabditis remanei]|uniref:Uncharacterized protein n=1 Tax=Caenorhabditis remanei TaxID=31234 RepID=A0A6A5HYY6_CAERE|nr:hypothetical protein GCK72_003469 [Caenorhabditis remanei]KAF1771642.1 hypothetical protein GCK72_003469 [Caenorhabditis remanei]